MLPFFKSPEEAVEFSAKEVQRLAKQNSWLVMALRDRMDGCPCTVGGCEACASNARLLKQVALPDPRPLLRAPCRKCGDTQPTPDSEFCLYCIQEEAR